MAHDGPGPARAETVDRVVARVNDEIVTEGDLARETERRASDAAKRPRGVELGDFLDRALLLQASKRDGFEPPKELLQRDVEEMVKSLRTKYSDDAAFRRALAGEGTTIERLKEDLLKRARTDWQVAKAVGVAGLDTEPETQAGTTPAPTPSTAVHLRRMGVKEGPDPAASADRLSALVEQANRDGLGFDDAVRRFSEVPGAAEDAGDMGWREPPQLSPAVAAAVRDLKPGQVTAPLVAGGFANIFYVEGRRENRKSGTEGRFAARKTALLAKLRKSASLEIYDPKWTSGLPAEYRAVAAGPAFPTTKPGATPPARGSVPGQTPAAIKAAGTAPAPAPGPGPSPTPTPAVSPRRKGLLGLFRTESAP